eukprot:64362-Prorocentrum_lima.AAC.1
MNARPLYGVVSDLTGGTVSVSYNMPAQEVHQSLPSVVNEAEANPKMKQIIFQAKRGVQPPP